MRVETNEKLVNRNRRIAQYLFFAAFGVVIIGVLFINQQASNLTSSNVALVSFLQAALLPVALITTIISVRMTNLWMRQPRPEVVIREGLKGISNRSVLYNYYHFPARHVLICPQGVYAMVTRFQDGRFTVDGDKWVAHRSAAGRFLSIFRFDNIGNPGQDAQRAAAHIKQILQPIAPDVEVQPVVVFVDPRANVTINNPTVPVVYATGKLSPTLKDLLRESGVSKDNRNPLTPDQIEAFEAASLPHR